MAKTITPDEDPIIARLDRIIALLEQQRTTPYVAPVYPVPLWRPYPYYPYQGPYWSSTTSVTAPPNTTIYNTTNGTASE